MRRNQPGKEQSINSDAEKPRLPIAEQRNGTGRNFAAINLRTQQAVACYTNSTNGHIRKIDLKLGKLTHQDVGQMDTYVRIYDEQRKGTDDNPTIGLILCSQKSEASFRAINLYRIKRSALFFSYSYFLEFRYHMCSWMT